MYMYCVVKPLLLTTLISDQALNALEYYIFDRLFVTGYLIMINNYFVHQVYLSVPDKSRDAAALVISK